MALVTTGLLRHDLCQPDGRRVSLYGDFEAAPPDYEAPARGPSLCRQRWHPLRQEWVMIASARQERTFLPSPMACPLCPSTSGHSSEVPAARFQLAVFENRFPAMSPSNDQLPTSGASPNGSRPNGGICEVVVYTADHDASFGTLSAERRADLVSVWRDRYAELGARDDVRYVHIFENRGEAVGVTITHPHGQIYGYPFMPPVVETELTAGLAHWRRHHRCLQCTLIESEVGAAERMLFVDRGIAAYVPAYARWPYEVHVAPIRHHGALTDMPGGSPSALADSLGRIARAYDRLFDVPMPYMMVVHQRPTDALSHPEAHLHVEFYPVMRAPGRLKFLAGGECGAGTFVSDGLPEEKAAELKKVL